MYCELNSRFYILEITQGLIHLMSGTPEDEKAVLLNKTSSSSLKKLYLLNIILE